MALMECMPPVPTTRSSKFLNVKRIMENYLRKRERESSDGGIRKRITECYDVTYN